MHISLSKQDHITLIIVISWKNEEQQVMCTFSGSTGNLLLFSFLVSLIPSQQCAMWKVKCHISLVKMR